MPKPDAGEHKANIQIDRKHYAVDSSALTGAQLRTLADPDVGADRDLFLVVPGGQDQKVGDDQSIPLKSGMRFFTAPGQINPGHVTTGFIDPVLAGRV
jgi:hypothetical protein